MSGVVPVNSGSTESRIISGTLQLQHSATQAAYTSGDPLGTTPEHVVEWAPQIDLTPGHAEPIVPGSVRLSFGGKTMVDRAGRMDQDIDHATNAGTEAGQLSYTSGVINLSVWTPGAANSGTVQAMLTQYGSLAVSDVVFRTAAAPIRSGSLIVQYQYEDTPGVVTVTSNTDGTITAADLDGKVDFSTGIVRLRFGRWVTAAGNEGEWWYHADAVRDGMAFKPRLALLDTLVYAAVAYAYIPLDKDILGVDAVRLPTDGRVPVFRTGDVTVLHHTGEEVIAEPYNGQIIDVGRTRLSRVELFEATGDKVATAKYNADLDAGTVELLDVAGLEAPLRLEHRIEDMALVSDVQISGHITLTRPVSHSYPAEGAYISSALVIGDMQARATAPFDQATWTGEWSDAVIGSETSAEYNSTLYPITVTNAGAIQERWALIFNNQTEVRVVGESVGQIAVLPIAGEIAPINPATGAPYFTIDPLGWGGGWSAGNVLRFNTIAANHPIWIARTVQQGPATEQSDGFRVQIRGDADA